MFAQFNDVILPYDIVTYKTKVTDNQSITVICHFHKGDPVGIRTRDPQLRRLLLYPAELPDHPSLLLNNYFILSLILKANAKLDFYPRLPKFQ